MAAEVKIEVKLDEVLSRLELLGTKVFPHTARAMQISANFIQQTWVNMAQGNDLSGKPASVTFRGSIDYANSIRIIDISPFHKQIVSDSEVGAKLAEGNDKPYDMKPALVNGPKSRVNEQGERYNIIPFRHKVKALRAQMVGGGQSAYDMARKLTQQKIVGFKMDSEGKRRFAYAKWTADKKLNIKNRMLAGLTRMKTSTGKSESSAYLTFRIVKLDQVGKWIRRPTGAWDILAEVERKTASKVEEFITNALKRDVGVE